jgi:hypothetical protein
MKEPIIRLKSVLVFALQLNVKSIIKECNPFGQK